MAFAGYSVSVVSMFIDLNFESLSCILSQVEFVFRLSAAVIKFITVRRMSATSVNKNVCH